jgi:NAD(P)-dependent dehydrogenase (short-subunit alcohol dehydrogenase family)
MKRFEGQVAVVTGGASGIGEAIVRALLAEGASVAVLDVNEPLLAERERELGPLLAGTVGDVTDEQTVERFTADCVERFGGIDAAFNVAGASRGGFVVDQALEDWQFTLDLCLTGVLLSLKHEARHMVQRGRGAIVNVSSVCAHFPVHAGAAYCSAKSGVEMLTKVAALELSERGIRVNAVLPGYTHTPGMRMAEEAPDLDREILASIPMRRAARPDDIAAPALFLATEEARYVAGASLVVDGGWELAGCPDLRGPTAGGRHADD